MKKIFLISVFFLFLANFSFAKTWTNNIAAGLTFEDLSIGVDKKNADDITQLGYGIDGSYIGFHENGFTAKANVAIGVATSKDVSIQTDKNTNIGAFENVSFGVGYSFVRTDRFLFGSTAMMGVEMSQYSVNSEDEELNGVKYDDLTTSLSLVTFSFGADIFAVFHFSERFGFYANIAARYLIAGDAKIEYKYETSSKSSKKSEILTDDYSLFGNFVIQPTLGVIWRF